ncbi:MAG TPA: tRNA uridine-5-carboxymethylaminomethyl(34) synthesis GTPase MnmE [Rhizomicrobium sp.]|nr:tRNA uridine-5-carboxymethylaminomethyl(34) synthesis GTPase MnmE [Rhizomicrobium sp.]
MVRADTIFALSTAPGRSGVAIVRVSGPQAGSALETLSGETRPQARMAALRRLRGVAGEIDRGLVLWFEAPASFTGEDCAEFHVHGGRAIVEAMLQALSALAGLRPAEPGEFTRRAVENGKLDLTRAEALADLIDAETEGQRRQALKQYEGSLYALYESWRTRLIAAAAWAEAAIDFSDEEIPEDVLARVRTAIREIVEEIQQHLDDRHRGELVRDGIYLTVIGKPNVGKSSLVNALARRDVAIVSEIAGTTRDIIEVRLNLGGYLVTLADTAGLRETSDAIESEGVRRALARAEAADLVILLQDGTAAKPAAFEGADLVVWNKADLPWPQPREGLRLSLKTGEGLDALVAALTEKVQQKLEAPAEAPPITRARHRHALEEAALALERALATAEPELTAEDVRLAMRAIGRITGKVDVEDLLDVIFRDFCIGK